MPFIYNNLQQSQTFVKGVKYLLESVFNHEQLCVFDFKRIS